VPCVLEKLLPLQAECSVIVARGGTAQVVHLPVQRNLHRDGILAVTEVHEGNLPASRWPPGCDCSYAPSRTGLNYVGVLCVEFFVWQDGADERWWSTRWRRARTTAATIRWTPATLSQFELQVRALAGLPLVQPRQHSPAIMLNLLGDLWFPQVAAGQGPACGRARPWAQVLALPGAHLHLYGKLEARPGRKMGHLTVTGARRCARARHALQAAALLGIAPLVRPAT
jgi:5-(carboxyamino)imidazole ribonucleotide synthase